MRMAYVEERKTDKDMLSKIIAQINIELRTKNKVQDKCTKKL